MIFSKFNPQKKQMFQILNETGDVVNKALEPKIDNETLLKIYQTMLLARIADTKAMQYQRQGRMLTYAPIKGQEAAQVGALAALNSDDWLVPAFRELAAMLYKGVSLKQLFLYWYGNEEGNHYDKDIKVLPIAVPIASQINHAAGVAYASMIKKKKEVVLAYVGDGGTSHGEFHEGLNFAAVFNLPMIVIIQNNQWAISTPRSVQTKSETLAQKAVAYGIEGILVDGNDALAMFEAVKTAKEKALNGGGPTLIEALTYRLGPHTTSDDPTIYRNNEEVEIWEKRDPLIRFKKYLEGKGLWNNEIEDEKSKEYNEYVNAEFKKVEESGLVALDEIFNYTYEELTKELKEQLSDYKKYLESEVK